MRYFTVIACALFSVVTCDLAAPIAHAAFGASYNVHSPYYRPGVMHTVNPVTSHQVSHDVEGGALSREVSEETPVVPSVKQETEVKQPVVHRVQEVQQPVIREYREIQEPIIREYDVVQQPVVKQSHEVGGDEHKTTVSEEHGPAKVDHTVTATTGHHSASFYGQPGYGHPYAAHPAAYGAYGYGHPAYAAHPYQYGAYGGFGYHPYGGAFGAYGYGQHGAYPYAYGAPRVHTSYFINGHPVAHPAGDADVDGIPNSHDAFPFFNHHDTDKDGIPNTHDAAPFFNHHDADSDGIPNGHDAFPFFNHHDIDKDGIPNGHDAFPTINHADVDQDGIPNGHDAFPNFNHHDVDRDGIPNGHDAFPFLNRFGTHHGVLFGGYRHGVAAAHPGFLTSFGHFGAGFRYNGYYGGHHAFNRHAGVYGGYGYPYSGYFGHPAAYGHSAAYLGHPAAYGHVRSFYGYPASYTYGAHPSNYGYGF